MWKTKVFEVSGRRVTQGVLALVLVLLPAFVANPAYADIKHGGRRQDPESLLLVVMILGGAILLVAVSEFVSARRSRREVDNVDPCSCVVKYNRTAEKLPSKGLVLDDQDA